MLSIEEFVVPPDVIKTLYQTGQVTLSTQSAAINSYLILRSEDHAKTSTMARHLGSGVYKKLGNGDCKSQLGIAPKDSKQTAFVDCLMNPNILINTAIGPAGTGKTTLALAYALNEYNKSGKRIILSKPAIMVGRGTAFGPVPGDINEKYAPYIESYKIVMSKLLSKNGDWYLDKMYEKKHIQFIPVEQTRGCTYENCTFIIDEAQNLSWHEINTLATRMGEGTKLIVLGDLNQIDTKLRRENTGLSILTDSQTYKASPITSAINLTTVYRSKITKLVIDIDKELRSDTERNKRQDTINSLRENTERAS